MAKFFIYTVLLMAFLAWAVLANQYYFWSHVNPSHGLLIIFFTGISTAIIFYFVFQRVDSLIFTQVYLLSIVLKMLTYSIFIIIVIYSDRKGAFDNALVFMVVYILFTGIEVGFLFQQVNRK